MQKVYVGTYTPNNSLIEFYLDKNELKISKKYTSIQYCSYIQIKNDTIYALSENDKLGNGFLFIINDNKVIKINSYGINPCYISVKKSINICNYSSSNICIFNGNCLKHNFYIHNSWPHCIIKHNNNLIIVDKNDRLLMLDTKMNLKTLYTFKKGTEPRHIVINNNVSYVISEKTNKLFIFQNYKFVFEIKISEGNGCAIKIYKNYLFTTTRETNLINVFDISNPIKPVMIQSISSYGKNPRDMDFCNDYLFVCNVDSNNISIFKFDEKLKYHSSFFIEKPFCICFKR